MVVLNTPTHLFKPDKAEELARRLNDDDEEWSYVVRHAPDDKGLSAIDVYDEDGVLVAQL